MIWAGGREKASISALTLAALDPLENGNGTLTLAEQRSHFTAWAVAKSPLLVGIDVRRL